MLIVLYFDEAVWDSETKLDKDSSYLNKAAQARQSSPPSAMASSGVWTECTITLDYCVPEAIGYH